MFSSSSSVENEFLKVMCLVEPETLLSLSLVLNTAWPRWKGLDAGTSVGATVQMMDAARFQVVTRGECSAAYCSGEDQTASRPRWAISSGMEALLQ